MSKKELERLKEILNLSDDIVKILDRLDKIQSTVSYIIDKYFTCGENRECEGLVKLVKRIREWLRIYECVEKYEVSQIMDLCLDKPSVVVDFNRLEIDKICIDLFECVYFDDLKLPLTETSKSIILDKIKSKLSSLVDNIDISYSKTLVMIVEILKEIEHDLNTLREKYKRLYKKLSKTE